MSEEVIKKIVLNNARREKYALSRYACRSHKGMREVEDDSDHGNIRSYFARDADRIMHSLAYARYIDKTQVFYLFTNDHITHRALHVQFVSKIGRTIGRALRLNEDLIEAIALGHDLGHVPYGHDGEKVLDEICQAEELGFFRHNAQSVRFLRFLERGGKGLNITLQVLDGILAHNGEMLSCEYVPQVSKTWSDHYQEYEACFTDKSADKKIVPMTLEGCVMRISDVLAYVGRDVEDAIILGVIKRTDIPLTVRKVLGENNRQIIDTLAMDLIKNSYGKDRLCFSEETFNALAELKEFNYGHVYFDKRIKTETPKMERMFRLLFDHYNECIQNEDKSSTIFTVFLNELDHDYIKETPPKRMVVDFLSGMTDKFFNSEFNRIFVPQKLGQKLEDHR